MEIKDLKDLYLFLRRADVVNAANTQYYGDKFSLIMEDSGEDKNITLAVPLAFSINVKGKKYEGYVPQGFPTDMASVPWVVQWKFPKRGVHSRAAVLHDWLYRSHYYSEAYGEPLGGVGFWGAMTSKSRKLADDIFYRVMLRDGVRKSSAYLMYRSVRRFGWMVWRSHTKESIEAARSLMLVEKG